MDTARGEWAEPFSSSNGEVGVLVLHGYTGVPASVRPLAEAFANAGFSVELPLLPGHGTTVEDLQSTTFADWSAAADEVYLSLSARTDRTIVVGHSMGGALACHLVEQHPEIVALVLINPMIKPPATSLVETLTQAVEQGVQAIPSIGADVKRSGVTSHGYDQTPIRPLLSLFAALDVVSGRLGKIIAPTILFSSRVDHVVPTDSSDYVEERIGGPIERVYLERSYHVATLDDDAGEIEARSIAFATKAMVN